MGEVDGEPVCIDRARDPEELERDRNGGGGDALASSSGDVHGDEETELRKEKERDVEMEEAGEDAEVEDEEGEEAGSGSDGDSFIDDESDGEGHSDTEDKNLEAPLTDAEIEELIAEFLEVESKAAEAQESLEKESLLRVESEVRGELAESLHGDELEIAVSMEMKTFSEEWQRVLNDLETESALLLEQLDGAGVELPTLYKWIESQAPNVCCTETWKKRTQWVGSELSSEITNSIKDAESFLQSCRPVRRQHGRLLEEGASGFLGRKFSTEDDRNAGTENSEKDWRLFNELIQSEKLCENSGAFGTKQWASVYMASTPRQAAIMGLNLPGIDEVEEISEIESNPSDPFYADAIANEKDIDLSEEQRRNFRKVKEEDDVHTTQKLQLQLKRLRQRSRIRKEPIESDSAAVLTENISRNFSFDEHSKPFSGGVESLKHGEGLKGNNDHNDVSINESDDKKPMANDTNVMLPTSNFDLSELKRPKRPHDDEDLENDAKRNHTVIIDSDDEVQVVEDKSVFGTCSDAKPMLQAMEVVDVDAFPSPSPKGLHNHPKANLQVFQCTSCSVDLKVHEVHRHPLLQVIVCESCNNVVKEQMNQKDRDCSECYCGWCGKSEDLISCSTCTTLFCTKCIKRNLGEEHLAEVLASSSQCCCCSPSLLHEFTLECDKALGSLDVTSSDSDSELSDVIADAPNRYKKMKKRRIRRILDDAELMEDTKRKIAIEKARQEHLKSLQEQSAIKSWTKNVSINGITTEGANVEMLGDANDGYIVNVVREKDEEPVRIPPSISAKLKPHQVSGIRFMWENIIQSIRKVKSGDKGLGCILAHTMGLGKTFQVIAFLYTAMRVVDLGLKTALIVTPVNVLHNWRHEFEKWKPLELKPLRVFMLEDVARERRAHLLAKWKAKGGVFLIGYASFRNLSLGKHVKDRSIATDISHALQNGPDVLICDEAHMIKNTRAGTTHALKQVKSQRRIALTGSPLQNNLMEYYCMVDFVREGFLGSSHEFRNRFQNPIENGQHTNSTSDDVKIMNQRSHILHEQLKGFVQRMDMNVVKKDLPPKTEFVIIVKLSPLQRKLYKRFLDVHGFTNGKISSEKVRRSCFFAAYQALAQIWNHPGLLQMAKEYKDKLRRQEAIENSLIDGSSSDDNVERDVLNGVTQKVKDSKKSDGIFFHEEVDWWEELLHEKIYKEVDYSGKMVLLLDILSMSSEMGDKALVFSQSLMTLDLIELFLSRLPQKGREGKCWKQGKDWYRLDGSTEGSERQKIVERFNDPTNKRVKCTLISTRAGSLGINLHAANRVIIIDGSWNPTNDLQAIYRVWRYGQIKPVYAYRLMAHKTMEEKIYKRQVTKEGLAARVVDRQQIHRTMSKEEVLHLFDFGDDENPDVPLLQCQEGTEPSAQNLVVKVVDSLVQKSLPSSSGGSSSDKVMDGLLNRHYSRWIAHYHEHETLLQENEEERLTKEEQDMAWVVFQRSLEWEEVHRVSLDEPDQTSAINHTSRVVTSQTQTKGSSKNRSVYQRKCNNLKHMLTLRSQGIKSGSSTVCGDCGMQISWDNLKDGKSR